MFIKENIVFILMKSIKNKHIFIVNHIKEKLLIIIILLFSIDMFCESMKKKINLVIPIASKDFAKIKINYKFYKKYVRGIKNIIFIGNEEVEKLIKKNNLIFEMKLKFINEKSLIDVDKIKHLIEKRNRTIVGKSGWYIQQFLKMQYCQICKEKYYLVWDCDTIPVKYVKMFNNEGKPFFDIKTEYHKPYFITIKKLMPELGKKNNYSFISEHMLITTKMMKNLIKRIALNVSIPGDKWYEKVINSIDIEDLPFSGFSEFETYGTFINEYYNNSYVIRPWNSLRRGRVYYNHTSFTFKEAENISKKYDAISFENW